MDAAVSRCDEVDAASSVLRVGLNVSRECRGGEVIEGHPEPHLEGVSCDEVLEQEEIHIAPEIAEQHKEVVVKVQCCAKWTVIGSVMASDAFEGEVESVAYSWAKSSSAVNSHLGADLVARKEKHSTDGVTDRIERFVLCFRQLINDVSHQPICRERCDDRVARQPELAKVRAVT